MIFEFDDGKSQRNLKKHGLTLEKARELWKSPYVEFAARREYENRFAAIGFIEGKLYTCIYALRGEKIRLISCRRARKKETLLYEKSINGA